MELKEKIKKVLTELNTGLYEKERTIRLTLLSVLAGESTFMLGEPGTAKSLIARRISEAFGIEKKDFFSYLMSQFSQPDEVFGPVSIQKLKCDEYERKTENYLPKAKFAFLDEIWKANPAIQNALLTILNEREFRNNGKTEKVVLIGFVSASNELPAKNQGLEAIFDRFLVRILERPVSKNSDSFRNMISDAQELPPVTEKITLEEIKEITIKAKDIKLSDECYEIISRIAKVTYERNASIDNNKEKWLISDRRWKKIVNLMRVSAFCNGRTETNIMDASIIADCIWQNESQEEEAKAIVKEAIENYGLECKANIENLKDELSIFAKQVDNLFFKEVISEREEEIDTPDINTQNFKKTIIDNQEFYIVKDSRNQKCYISINKYATRSGYNCDQYYLNGTTNHIYGRYEKNQFIKTDSCAYENERYTLIQIRIIKTSVLQIDSFFQDKPEQGKKIVEDFNKNSYDPIYKKFQEELLSIEKQIEECYTKYGDNLFIDNNSYLSVITTKLTDSKVQINDLIAKLAEQKERYDIIYR